VPRRAGWAAATLAIIALAGCGGGDSNGDEFNIPQAREDVRNVIEQLTVKGLEGDGEGTCSYATDRYREEIVRETKGRNQVTIQGDTCEEVIESAKPLVEKAVPSPNLRIDEINVSPTRADALTTIDTAFGQSQTRYFLVRRDGDWLIDHDRDVKVPRGTASRGGNSP
jgi:hypothetical protein